MIDLQLAKSLMSAIARHTRVILVGDKDQLPSVGAGRVFADLLATESMPRVVLQKVFRQAESSSIITFAHDINHGVVPDLPVPDGEVESDTYFLPRKEPERIASLVNSLFCSQVRQKFNIPSKNITILTPTNRGPLGTIELNQRIQKSINPDIAQKPRIDFDSYQLTVGDRVCQRVNNYQIDDQGVFNGDQGIIVDVDSKAKALTVELWDGRHIHYQGNEVRQLSLAYAMSIHRSQGSEISCVIMVLHDSHFILLDRQLLYTGMTRAKQLLIIVGSRRALAMSAQKAQAKNRNTYLRERI